MLPPVTCAENSFPDIDEAQMVNNFERMLEYAQSVDQQEDYSTFGEFHQTLFGDGPEATDFVDTYENEQAKYTSMGYEGYISDTEHLSSSLKSYLINYSQTLNSFLNNELPNLEEFTQFTSNQIGQLPSSQLCSNDQSLMKAYLLGTQGFANWYYKKYYNATNLDIASVRGCNFFQFFYCAVLALTVGLIVWTISSAILLFATITLDDQEVKGDAKVELAIVAGLALGIYVGINIYEWCCKKVGSENEQDCLAPTGSSYIQTDCANFTYRVFGPSYYGTTVWSNTNATPGSMTTIAPVINVNVPSFGDPSQMTALIACIENEATVSFYSWDETLTYETQDADNYFPLTWVDHPPFVFNNSSGNTIYASVNTPTTDLFSYNWNVSSPHSIVSGGGANHNWVKIQVNPNSPFLTTTVTAKNNCLNISESLSHTTLIEQ